MNAQNYDWINFFEALLDKICKLSDDNIEASKKLYKFYEKLPLKGYDFDRYKMIDPLTYIACVSRNDGNINQANKDFMITNKPLGKGDGIPSFSGFQEWVYMEEPFQRNKHSIDIIINTLWKLAKGIEKCKIDQNVFSELLGYYGNTALTLSKIIFICKPKIFYSCDENMTKFTNQNTPKNFNEYLKFQEFCKNQYSNISPYEVSYNAWKATQDDKQAKKAANPYEYEIDKMTKDSNTFWKIVLLAIYKNDPTKSYSQNDIKELDFYKEVSKISSTKGKQIHQAIWKKSNLNPNINKNNILYETQDELMFHLTSKGMEEAEKIIKKLPSKNTTSHGTQEDSNNTGDNKMDNSPKNLILYGPPGTGKTYNTIVKAMEIIGSKEVNMKDNDGNFRTKYSTEEYKLLKDEFNTYKNEERIEFITFHQSYSYEEFVEGIKPDLESDDLKYELKDGIFKRICKNAKQIKTSKISGAIDFTKTRIFKMSLGANWENETEDIYNYCLDNNVIALGWGEDKDFSNCNNTADFKALDNTWGAKAVEIFKNWMRIGDIVLISNGNSNIKAIARITGEYEYHSDREIRYCQYRKVEWLYSGEDIPVSKFYDKKLSQQAIYGFYSSDKEGKQDYNSTIKTNILNEIITGNINDIKAQPYVLIIDEINRGNISKIFGELITLIEDDKRLGADNEMTVTLPYSQQKDFGVPNNLYIIGTMNTADKSIAQLDTALRRRFVFEQMPPQEELLKEASEKCGYNLVTFLRDINTKIENKLDKHHKIGHAYLINVKNEPDLERAFLNKIYPLLQEYFYDDESDIAEIFDYEKETFKELVSKKDWWKTVISKNK